MFNIKSKFRCQLGQLKHCDKIFKEKLSGGNSDRPELHKAIDYLREGDSLVITHRLDIKR